MVKIAASVFSADLTRLAESIREIEEAGADCFHVDVMDGHFVPTFGFHAAFVKALRACTGKPIEVHLQTLTPWNYFDQFLEAGADSIGFHLEQASGNAARHLDTLRNRCKAGLYVSPDSDLATVLSLVSVCDDVTLLGTRPGGLAGSVFNPATLDRLGQVSAAIREQGASCDLSVDGDVQALTGHQCIQAGATKLVIGKALFNAGDRRSFIAHLKEIT